MANPRAFISSTCYDLAEVRDSLVEFIISFGFDPVLSDRGDVFYHPDLHTHESCRNEVGNCQLFLLIIGGRFGGEYKADTSRSIVNAEYQAAREEGIPVFTFLKKSVYADHHVYVKNRSSTLASQIHFPSIDQQEYALKIFEFIDEVRKAPVNNGLFAFDYAREIKETLRKQWAGMFFDFLQQRSSSNQFQVATSLLKNISLAGEKVEELVKGLYRHIDKTGADQMIDHVETRALAKEFFANALDRDHQQRLSSEQASKLATGEPKGKWYEYLASALDGIVLTVQPFDSEATQTLALEFSYPTGRHAIVFDPEDSRYREQQIRFEALKSLRSDQIREILRELDYPVT